MKRQPKSQQQPTLEDLRRIDSICSQFEQAWKTGRKPKIEDYLSGIKDPLTSHLFYELLQMEGEFLANDNATLEITGYCKRFPQYQSVIESVFPFAFPRQETTNQHSTYKAKQELMETSANLTDFDLSGFEENIPEKIGEFEIIRMLGKGGMGIVYLARHVHLQRLVALKLIQDSSSGHSEHLARFRMEAMAVARQKHPNILQIHDIGKWRGRPFLVLEYVDGINLADYLLMESPPPQETATLLEIVAKAVHAAHLKGIIHRDLKPANILLAKSEDKTSHDDGLEAYIPKVADFGLAKDFSENGTPSNLTRSSLVVGTPWYMTPEQARAQQTSPRSDVFALGIILYEMLTGRPPFQSESAMETLQLICNQEPTKIRWLRRDCPPDLETICMKCLEKEPNRRYPSAQALAQDLRRFLRGEAVMARPLSPLGRTWRWVRRHPVVAALVTLVWVVLLAGIFSVSYFAFQVNQTNVQLTKEQEKTRKFMEKAKIHLYASQVCLSQREIDRGMEDKGQMILDGTHPTFRKWEFNYLRNYNAQKSNRLIKRNNGPAKAIAIRADGQLLTLDNDGIVRLIRNGQETPVWKTKINNPSAAAFSQGGKKLAIADSERNVEVWEDGKRIWSISNPAPVNAFGFSPDGKNLAIADSAYIVVWNLETKEKSASLDAGGTIHGLAFHPNGKALAVAHGEQFTRILSLPDGEEEKVIASEISGYGHTGPILSTVFSGDGSRLVSAGMDKMVKLWEVQGSQDLLTLVTPRSFVTSLAFSPDGFQLAAGTGDGTIYLWNADPDKSSPVNQSSK